MNLIDGHIQSGVFTTDNIKISGVKIKVEVATKLVVRPEDCSVIETETKTSHMTGEVYSVEPTGDTTFLTLRVGQNQLEIKADRSYRANLGLVEKVALDTERLYLFDVETGQRVR
jgi:multiple sugar transport system ATP-binding protein